MFSKISILTFAFLCTSVLAAEIGSFKRDFNIKSEESRRQKRFIIQFQVPSPVGHFQVAMVPPFITSMMANIPNIIRRNFLFGGFQQQQLLEQQQQQQQLLEQQQQQQQLLEQQQQQQNLLEQQQQQILQQQHQSQHLYEPETTEPLPY
ncbi:unnamed protein product [Allacma fusca]|uniref:Uncharacterized protein n=1 Tax=Allacma fusca TaxID=39272 RepID=A0A8J2JL92_9HEXA|nr:unnamed protein product [Allacma fusca]